MLYCKSVTARRAIPAAAVVVVLALAGLGYANFIPVHSVATGRLAALLPSKSPPGFSKKPASSSPLSAKSSPFPEVKTAAKKSPKSTGSYSVQWTKPAPSTDTATILVTLLPNAGDAAKTNSEATTLYLNPKSLQTDGYAYVGSLKTGLPGSDGSVFKSTAAGGGPPLAVVVFAKDRAQVTLFSALAAGQSQTESSANSLAHNEYSLLQRKLPGFTLVRTTLPVTATAVFWGVTAALVLLIVGGPVALRKGKERRRLAREISRRRQLQSRGSKIARRQAQKVR